MVRHQNTHDTIMARSASTILPEILSAGGGIHGDGITPMHEHNGHEIVIVTAGSAEVSAAEQTFQATAGTALLFPQGARHDQRNRGVTSWHVVFRCPGRRFLDHPAAVRLEAGDPVLGWIAQLGSLHLSTASAISAAAVLLAILEHLGPRIAPAALPAVLRQALRVIDDSLACDYPDMRLAHRCGISDSHLRRLFRLHLEDSPHAIHEQRRLDLAAKLLRSSYLSMQQVSDAIGWQDANYFARRFAQRFGQRPRAWRQSRRA
jgi:AraC-like DNA-binding protein